MLILPEILSRIVKGVARDQDWTAGTPDYDHIAEETKGVNPTDRARHHGRTERQHCKPFNDEKEYSCSV